jgi:hypothetical protein
MNFSKSSRRVKQNPNQLTLFDIEPFTEPSKQTHGTVAEPRIRYCTAPPVSRRYKQKSDLTPPLGGLFGLVKHWIKRLRS